MVTGQGHMDVTFIDNIMQFGHGLRTMSSASRCPISASREDMAHPTHPLNTPLQVM